MCEELYNKGIGSEKPESIGNQALDDFLDQLNNSFYLIAYDTDTYAHAITQGVLIEAAPDFVLYSPNDLA